MHAHLAQLCLNPFLNVYYVLAVCLIVDNILCLDVHYKCVLCLFNTLSCRVGTLQIPIVIIITVTFFVFVVSFIYFQYLLNNILSLSLQSASWSNYSQ